MKRSAKTGGSEQAEGRERSLLTTVFSAAYQPGLQCFLFSFWFDDWMTLLGGTTDPKSIKSAARLGNYLRYNDNVSF